MSRNLGRQRRYYSYRVRLFFRNMVSSTNALFRAFNATPLGSKGQVQWEQIALVVGRTAGDCKDRWNNHLKIIDRNTGVPDARVLIVSTTNHFLLILIGKWTEDETRLLREAAIHNQGSNFTWDNVSKAVGTRTRQQCIDKCVRNR